jgi:hypothetical protein
MKNHWKSLWSALKKSKVALAYDSEFHFGYISKINESSLKSFFTQKYPKQTNGKEMWHIHWDIIQP